MNRYDIELKNKNYLALALYDEFTYWQETNAQDDEEYFKITDDEIWEVIDKTIGDQQFNDEMWACFDFYLSHYRNEEE